MKNISRENHQLLHMQIKDAILKEYASSGIPENTLFPSVRELVREFKTSIVTIEKTVKELKKEGIIYSVPNVGTFWGRKKIITRYRTVGVRFNVASLAYIMPDTYFFHMLQGIEEVFAKYNLHTKLLRYDSLDYTDNIRELNCDAVICTGTYLPVMTAVDNFRKLNIPYLLLDRPCGDDELNYLERDSAKNIEEIVDYLVGKGHRKICCAGLDPKFWIYKKLYIGFENGMRKHNLDFSRSMLELPDFSGENLAKGNLKDILKKHTALIILSPLKNDVKAILEYCDSNNIKVPASCSVVSLSADSMVIGDRIVTSSVITPYEMGIEAAEGIVALLNNTVASPFHIEFPLRIIEGNTIKDLRSSNV